MVVAVISVGHTAWAPEEHERQIQAGPKGPKPAHRLLVFHIFFRGCFQKLDGTVEQGWTQRVWYCQQEKVFLKAFPQSGWCIAWLLTPPWMGSQCRYSRDKIPQATSYLSCSREGFRWILFDRGLDEANCGGCGLRLEVEGRKCTNLSQLQLYLFSGQKYPFAR